MKHLPRLNSTCTFLAISACLSFDSIHASERQNPQDILRASIGLMLAIDSGDSFAAGHRLREKADPNTTISCNGRSASALGHACAQQRYSITQALLHAKADPNIPTQDGVTPLMETVKAVPEIGSVPLIRKLKTEQIPAVKTLLQHNADPTLQDTHGKRATDYTSDEVIKKILESKTE
jgi:ankyrin repeat protein